VVNAVRTNRTLAISEAQFTVRVVRLADLYGWHGRHDRNSESGRGIHTFTRSDHACGMGWPDWVFVKDGRQPKFRELKTETGRVSRHQRWWGDKLLAAGLDWAVWRPSMLDSIAREFAW